MPFTGNPRDENEWVDSAEMPEIPVNSNQYLIKAKALVLKSFNRGISADLTLNEIYIVWFAKVLGNWKALISTDKWPGMYWEVTYNGAKEESYVDCYMKSSNKAIADSELS